MTEMLAIDFGGSKVALGIVSDAGQVRARQRFAIDPSMDAHDVMAQAMTCAVALLKSDLNRSTAGVGVASPGVIRDNGISFAPNVPGWESLRLRHVVEEALDLPTVALNDARAATLAEVRWGVLRDVDNGLHVNLGTGLSVGIVLNGQVVAGAHDAAGEIGYMQLEPGRSHQRAGHRYGTAPLEERFGGRGLGQRASAEFGRSLSAAELFQESKTDVAVATFLSDELHALAMHITNLAIALDPEVVSLGGGLLRSGELIVPVVRDSTDRCVPFPPTVTVATFADDGPLVGAAAAAFASLAVGAP
jgi:glucokinase